MSTDNPGQPTAAPKWQRLPLETRLRLSHLIASHLRVHGSQDYGALRDHPEFAQWFGTHLGARGEKRFDRMVASVRQAQPRKTSRGSQLPSVAIPVEPSPTLAETNQSGSAAKQLASGGAPSFEALQMGLWDRLREIDAAIARCVNELGEIVDIKTYSTLLISHRATTVAIAQLSRQFHDALTSPAVLEPLVDRMLNEAGDRQAAGQLATEVSELLKRETGLHAIRSEP